MISLEAWSSDLLIVDGAVFGGLETGAERHVIIGQLRARGARDLAAGAVIPEGPGLGNGQPGT